MLAVCQLHGWHAMQHVYQVLLAFLRCCHGSFSRTNTAASPTACADIPSVAVVEPGEVFKVECLDWTGGQIGNNDSADDIKSVDLSQVRSLCL